LCEALHLARRNRRREPNALTSAGCLPRHHRRRRRVHDDGRQLYHCARLHRRGVAPAGLIVVVQPKESLPVQKIEQFVCQPVAAIHVVYDPITINISPFSESKKDPTLSFSRSLLLQFCFNLWHLELSPQGHLSPLAHLR
jgi:hypothetical protein